MTWHTPEAYCLSVTRNVVRYGVQKPPKSAKATRVRHVFTIAAEVVKAMGWKAGDRADISFGTPGTDHAGKALIKRLAKGRVKLVGQKMTPTLSFQTSFVSPWIACDVHSREDMTWRKSKEVADALEVDLPAWAIKPQQRFTDSPRAVADKGSHGAVPRSHNFSLTGSSAA